MPEPSESFVKRLRDSALIKTATVYVIGGWLTIQFFDIALEAFDAPAWMMQSVLILVLSGFPLTLLVVAILRRDTLSLIQRMAAAAVITVSVLGSSYVYFQYAARSQVAKDVTEESAANTREHNPVIAILPFANMSASADNEFLADGMTEDIITLLAQSPGLEVIARNSTFKYKGQNPDIRSVGTALGADYVIEGSIRPIGERVRVTVQVIDANDGAHIWAEKYDRPFNEFFAIQDEVSLGVAAASGDAVFREEYQKLNQSRTDDLSAWELTSKAMIEFNTLVSGYQAVELLEEAIRLDPNYALPYAVLGRSYAGLALYGRAGDELFEKAEGNVRKALALSPDDPRVLSYSALTLMWCGKLQEAVALSRKAIEISPSYAEGLAYYGDSLTHAGNPEDGIVYLSESIRLTPYAPEAGMYYLMRGEAEISMGQFDKAAGTLAEANRLALNAYALILQAGAELMSGRESAARDTFQKLAETPGSSTKQVGVQIDILNRYTKDGGGQYFRAMWQALLELEETIQQ